VLFKPFTKLFGLLTYCICFPLWERSRWLSKENLWIAILEATKERWDTKGTHTALLRVLLLSFSDKARDVFDARWVFILETETLALKSGFVYQNPSISLKSRKSDRKMLIYLLYFTNCAHILKLSYCTFLNSEHNYIFTRNRNGRATSIYSFKGILYLEKLSVWCENCDRFVVLCHKK